MQCEAENALGHSLQPPRLEISQRCKDVTLLRTDFIVHIALSSVLFDHMINGLLLWCKNKPTGETSLQTAEDGSTETSTVQ